MRLPPGHGQRRRAFGGYAKRARLRDRGDGPVVLRPCRRHAGPQQTKMLGTHLPATVTVRAIVGVDRRRWWGELWCKAWNRVMGVGQHQVTRPSEQPHGC